MKTCIVIAVALLAAAPVVAQDAARLKDLTSLADKAQTVAHQWLDGPWEDEQLKDWAARRPLNDQLETLVRRTWYDEASIEALRLVLAVPRKDPVNLYVIHRLIQPLLGAKTQVIRKALPIIESRSAGLDNYKSLPEYTPGQIEKLKAADDKELAKVEPARLEKLKKELPLQFHNEQVARLNRTLWQLKVYANEARWDRELIGMAASLERRGLWDYTTVLTVVRAEINKMEKDRAERFYEAFKGQWQRALARPANQQTRSYADPASVKITEDAAPAGGTHRDRAATRLLKTINLLATRARLPALQTPRPRKTTQRPTDKRK